MTRLTVLAPVTDVTGMLITDHGEYPTTVEALSVEGNRITFTLVSGPMPRKARLLSHTITLGSVAVTKVLHDDKVQRGQTVHVVQPLSWLGFR